MSTTKSIFFASDFHLGLPTHEEPCEREQRIVDWLHYIKPSAEELFLLGDIFDFWFEYRYVVPKGFIRFLATLAEFHDAGIPVHILTGNHDVWLFDYLPQEVGVNIIKEPHSLFRHGHRLYICHGDEVGHRPLSYRIMRKVFHSKTAQRLFAWLIHPDLAYAFAHRWSQKSRKVKPIAHTFRGKDEPLIQFFTQQNTTDRHSLYLAGHLHIPVLFPLPDETPSIVLGDWISAFTYAELTGNTVRLMRYSDKGKEPSVISTATLPCHDACIQSCEATNGKP